MKPQKLSLYLATLVSATMVGLFSTSSNLPTQALTAEKVLQTATEQRLATRALRKYDQITLVNQEIPLAIAPVGNSSFVLAQVSPLGGVLVILLVAGVAIAVIVLPGFIQIGQHEVGIVRKKFGEPTQKLVALDAKESGWQAETLDPGLHWRFPGLYEIRKEKAICIDPDKIGIVEAKDGASLQPGENFGKVIIECDSFQKAHVFFKKGGQRGKQLAILNPGIYRINTELFNVEIRDMIRIHADQVGIVEAKDGASLPPGKNFGKLVECKDFQNAQAFFDRGGQRGKQLAILNPGTYQINTELFKVQRDVVIRIEAGEVGIVEAKDGVPLPYGKNFGKFVECDNFQNAEAFFNNGGQRGKQLAILKAGIYQINTALFEVRKAPIVKILPGEIGLIISQDGTPLSDERILGRVVECDNFQDAQAFFDKGGQRGKQLAILRAGEYQINTDLFTIVTTANATQHGMKPEDLKLYTVDSDKIGIVTTYDGLPTPEREIAGSVIEGHHKFQNGQKFIDGGGFRGLQEEFLQEGAWSLNPWFIHVEQVPLTEIFPDQVGVVISYVGKNLSGISNDESRLVGEGCKGIQKIPLPPGRYAINKRIQSVEIVPTNAIVLEWSNELKPSENYDVNLKALKLRSQDGFPFEIAVTQVICIAPEDASKMVLRVGSHMAETSKSDSSNSSQKKKNNAIKNLVVKVLSPMIDSYFQNAAQDFEALDFLARRAEIQAAAADHIQIALNEAGVQALGTFINITDLPDELEEHLKKRKVLEEERKTLEDEGLTERLRQELVREREITKAQVEQIQAEQDLKNAEFKAQTTIKEAEAQSAAKRLIDDADLETEKKRLDMDLEYKSKLRENEEALQRLILDLSPELYTKIESEKAWSQALAQLKIDMPEIFIGGSSGNSPGTDALQAGTMQFAWMDMLRDMLRQREPKQINTPKVEVLNPASDND